MIASNIICRGASRFLNTAYFQDVSISGTATLSSLSLSGNLSVTGNTTLGGTLGVTGAATFGNITATGTVVFSKTQDLSGTANSSPALIVGGTATSAHMELDANEIHAKATGTTVADLYLNNQGGKVYLSGNSVYASGSTFVAPTGNIATFNSTNVNVTNNLRANHYDLQTVAQLGGSFYVSPTVKFPNSGTTLTVAKSGSTLTLTITDSSITSTTMAGVVWTAGSGVKVSGTINGVVTGTMDGTVSSINTSSHTLTLSVSGENSANVVAGTYTASQFINLTVMLYTRKQDGTNKMINTASGAIASFTDGGNNVPVKQLVVDIEPVQDLHGYDAPWAGGGGKNLLNNTATTKTVNGITFTVNSDGTITANGTATADAQIQIGFSGLSGNYKFTGCPSGGGSGKYDVYPWDSTTGARFKKWNGTTEAASDFGNTLQEIQIPSGHNSIIVCRVSKNYTANNIVFKPMIVASTVTDATFAPYSNICPISGHTSAVVTRCGFNIWDEVWELGNINTNGQNEDASDRFRSKNYISVLPSSRYKLVTPSALNLRFYDRNKNIISYTSASNYVDTPENCYYLRFICVSTTYGNNISINYPATDTSYHEGHVQTVTISLNGTRYGGTLDVGTGVMTVTHKCVTFDGVTSGHAVTSVGSKESTDPYNFYQPHSDGYLFKGEVIGGSGWVSTGAMINHGMIYSHGAVDNSKSQTYHLACYVGGGGTVLQPRIFIPLDAGIDTVAKCNDWLAQQYANGTPVQYIYPLAEPFTVQLPRTEVRTLSGYNNIWSNTGDTNVIYESSQVDSTNNYNVGIWMNCYDQANSSSTIRVYNGSSRWPNVFLGNMTNADLPLVNGNAPYGYGLYSDNVFLRGIISATGGLIGNWTIGTTGMFYNSDAPGSTSITMIPGGTAASTTSIGGSSGSKSWIFTGKNLFGIDTTGKLYASSAEISGKITATSGYFGGSDGTNGWEISTGKIQSTYTYNNATKYMGIGTYNHSWAFYSGASTNGGSDGVFKVGHGGEMYATNAHITGEITAQSGTIGGFHITSSSNQGTSSAGGHIYTNSLYRHSGDGTTYEYEFGMKGDAAENPSSSSTATGNLAFYVKRINKGAAWNTTNTNMFFVTHKGHMYCQDAEIGPWNVTTTSIYKKSNTLGSDTSGAAYFGNLGLSVGNKFKVDANGVATLGLSSGYHATMDTDSFDVLNGSTMLATFGADSVIGNTSTRCVSINSDGFKFNSEGKTAFYIGIDNRSGSTASEATGFTFPRNPETKYINSIPYYLLTTISSDRTVIEVDVYAEMADPEAESRIFFDWVVDNNKLYINCDEVDQKYDAAIDHVSYIYTTNTNTQAPYCIIGDNAYSSSNTAGTMSFAQGYKCLALGAYSTSVGQETLASGTSSFSLGKRSEAHGAYSFAGGALSTSKDFVSFAYGYKSNAWGKHSVAFGNQDLNTRIFEILITSCDTEHGDITFRITQSAEIFEDYISTGSILVSTDNQYIFEDIVVTSGGGTSTITFSCVLYGGNFPAVNSVLHVRVNPPGSYGNGAMSVNACCASGISSTALGIGTAAATGGSLAIGMYNIPESNVLFSIGNGTMLENHNAMTVDLLGNVVASGNIACTGVTAPLFLEKSFQTGNLSVGANAAFSINFNQLSGYSIPSGYRAIAFSHISVNNNYLYFRWMNPVSNYNGAIAVGRNSSASTQTFVLQVRIIFAQTSLFGT